MLPVKYKGYMITYDPKPIPSRKFDYDFAADDYDGAPNEPGGPPADNRCGNAESVEEAKELIDDIEEEGGA